MIEKQITKYDRTRKKERMESQTIITKEKERRGDGYNLFSYTIPLEGEVCKTCLPTIPLEGVYKTCLPTFPLEGEVQVKLVCRLSL